MARRLYPDDLESEMKQELAALADIEVRHELLTAHVSDLPMSEAYKDRLLMRLNARRENARKSHALRLAQLHQRAIATTMFIGGADQPREVEGSRPR